MEGSGPAQPSRGPRPTSGGCTRIVTGCPSAGLCQQQPAARPAKWDGSALPVPHSLTGDPLGSKSPAEPPQRSLFLPKPQETQVRQQPFCRTAVRLQRAVRGGEEAAGPNTSKRADKGSLVRDSRERAGTLWQQPGRENGRMKRSWLLEHPKSCPGAPPLNASARPVHGAGLAEGRPSPTPWGKPPGRGAKARGLCPQRLTRFAASGRAAPADTGRGGPRRWAPAAHSTL